MRFLMTLVAVMTIVTTISAPVSADVERAPIGTLTCSARAAGGWTPETVKALSCAFRAIKSGQEEFYRGEITKFANGEQAYVNILMVWTAWAPQSTTITHGALLGRYFGIAVDDPRARGMGAHVLIGGAAQTITLQPVLQSDQHQSNLVSAVSMLELHPAGI